MFRRLLPIVLISFQTALISAQQGSGTLKGRVLDNSGQPVSGLHIILETTPYGTITGKDGAFVLKKIPAGRYTIVLNHIAFKPQRLQGIVVTAGQVQDLETVALTERILSAPKLVVTAARQPRSVEELSPAVAMIPQLAMREQQAQSLPMALREVPGLFVQKTTHAGGSANIRGLSSNQILLLVDGIRLNNSTYRRGNHPYLGTVDYNMISQLEVVRGPMSVLYGSDALGGVINAVTRSRHDLEADDAWHIQLDSRLATADDERMGRLSLSRQSKNWSLDGGFSLKHFGDLRRGREGGNDFLNQFPVHQRPTGYEALDGNAKFIYHPWQHRRVIMAVQHSERPEIPRYDKYFGSSYYRWDYLNQRRQLAYVQLQDDRGAGPARQIKATLSFQRQGEDRHQQKKADSAITLEEDATNTWGFSLQAGSGMGLHQLTYGAELYTDRVSSQAHTIDGDTRTRLYRGRFADDSRYQSFGAFIQDEIQATSRFWTTLGARYSRSTADFVLPLAPDSDATESLNQNFDAVTASLGLSVQLNRWTTLHANTAQGFKAPDLSDLSKLGQSKGDIWEVPNPDLKPERMFSWDMGMKIRSPLLSASLFYFHSTIEDALERGTAQYLGASIYELDGQILAVKSQFNSGRARLTGLEAEATMNLPHDLYLQGVAAGVRGQNLTLDQPMSKIPPTRFLAKAGWRTERCHTEIIWRAASAQNRLSEDDRDDSRINPEGTQSWQTLNVRIRWSLTRAVTLGGAVNNIFDRNYREHGSGINASGRNFILSVSLQAAPWAD